MSSKENNYEFISASHPKGRKLYKYFSNVEYAVNCIRKQMIHLDDPKTFNDPFDATFSCPSYTYLDYEEEVGRTVENLEEYVLNVPAEHQTPHTKQIILDLISLKSQKSYANMHQPISTTLRAIYDHFLEPQFSYEEFCENINAGFKETKRVMSLNCKISCFSEVCDSILIWSYYANCHRGVCVEFDLSRLDNSIPLNKEILNNISMVHYTPIRPDLSSPDNSNTSFEFLTTKAEVWSHEHEWRLICDTNEDFLPFNCISKVIIGAKFDVNAKKYKDLTKAVRAHENLPIYKCMLSSTKYQIEFKYIYGNTMYSYFLDDVEDEQRNFVGAF